jgi:chemotaxis protein methyltransferase CheR
MFAAYSEFCNYLQRVSGIVIGEDKKYLVESRIVPIVRREKLSGLGQLLNLLESGRHPRLEQDVIHAMTINETYFFRDKAPFDVIADGILPKLHESLPATDPIRIWSAACSTGQEPHSLSMLLDERQHKFKGRRFDIIGTDVSETVLSKAKQGIYSDFEVERGLAPDRIKKHFTRSGTGWKLNQALIERTHFRSLNLLADYTPLGSFDLIMCRNVLIYFNATQKADVLKRLTRCLRPGGFLMVGASESVMGATAELVRDAEFTGCFRRAAAGSDSARIGELTLAKGPSGVLAPRSTARSN